jgi:DNA (cytosine-5)-methyltransferase 1
MPIRYEITQGSSLLQLQEAKKRIVATLHNQIFDDTEALATHWLQNPFAFAPHLTGQLQKKCLSALGVTVEQTTWLSAQRVAENSDCHQMPLPLDWSNVPYPPPKTWFFTFIDLFAGIGGFHIAMHKNGGKCVFASEWNSYAKKTYAANFGLEPFGDITKMDARLIPDHDVICAGFPCQPFSLAGVSKKNSLGRKHGFADKTQGTLFFDVCRIIKTKRPKAFFLENVKNLVAHDQGQTFQVISNALDELGYVWTSRIVNGSRWVPQHRERIFMVGYDPDQVPGIKKEDIIIPTKPDEHYAVPQLKDIINPKLNDNSYTLGDGTWNTLKRHKAHHEKAGHGFGYGLHKLPIASDTITRTISARYHKDGAEILIEQAGKNPRRLTITEAMQLQGYDPKTFLFPVSRTQAYHQIGNSVVVPAIEATAHEISLMLKRKGNSYV